MQVFTVVVTERADANARNIKPVQDVFLSHLIELAPLLTHTASTPAGKKKNKGGTLLKISGKYPKCVTVTNESEFGIAQTLELTS